MAHPIARDSQHLPELPPDSCRCASCAPGPAASDAAAEEAAPTSNLQIFLNRTTPIVPIYQLSKCYAHLRPWKPPFPIENFYFHLRELWESFSEWSTVGVGVPITLPSKQQLTQYYVPYLSAIQLYSSGLKLVRRPTAGNNDTHTGPDERLVELEACQCLRFQYTEYEHPACRVPLYFKVQELACNCPELKNLCSNNLSCSSWMSVVWRPILRIPAGITIHDVETTFLTYHSLSTSLLDDRQEVARSLRLVVDKVTSIALDPFGVAAYGLLEHLWTSENSDHELYQRLHASSQAWLDQLQVSHHDFEFYKAHAPKHPVCR